jgi:hypothetical protein
MYIESTNSFESFRSVKQRSVSENVRKVFKMVEFAYNVAERPPALPCRREALGQSWAAKTLGRRTGSGSGIKTIHLNIKHSNKIFSFSEHAVPRSTPLIALDKNHPSEYKTFK